MVTDGGIRDRKQNHLILQHACNFTVIVYILFQYLATLVCSMIGLSVTVCSGSEMEPRFKY